MKGLLGFVFFAACVALIVLVLWCALHPSLWEITLLGENGGHVATYLVTSYEYAVDRGVISLSLPTGRVVWTRGYQIHLHETKP